MSSYETLRLRITGVYPLLMHSGQLADPLNPHSKRLAEITGKRSKTDADHLEAARREFRGCLYVDENNEPVIPSEAIEGALIAGAKKDKLGSQAKAGILVQRHARLDYKGPRDPEGLWKDERFRLRVPAKVAMARVIRTRPMFTDWSADVEIDFLPSIINEESVRVALVKAGEQVGLLDWRPKYGRFTVHDIAEHAVAPRKVQVARAAPKSKRRS